MDWLVERLMNMVPVLLSLSVHEFAHAWSAHKLGDETAAEAGRLTLDPSAHIDPIGTLLLPLLGVPFGWAKPVPVNPMRFRPDVDKNWGMMVTAAAGPISNVLLAITCVVALAIAFVAVPHRLIPLQLMERAIAVNIALAIFNMIPVPPLDGSRVVAGLLPRSAWPAWKTFTRFSPIVLMMVVLAPGHMTSWLYEAPIAWTFSMLQALIKLLGG